MCHSNEHLLQYSQVDDNCMSTNKLYVEVKEAMFSLGVVFTESNQ